MSEFIQWLPTPQEIRNLYSQGAQRVLTGITTLSLINDGELIDCDATAGAFTVTLPARATIGKGRRIILRKKDSTANLITIDGNAAETLNGNLTITLSQRYSAVILVATDTEWAVIGGTEGVGFALALTTGAYATLYQWNADAFGAPGGLLQLTKTDGSRLRRTVAISHNNVSGGADATVALLSAADGLNTHADFDMSTPDWLDADLSGAAAAQVVRLRLKATANGPSWTATFYPDTLKAA